MLIRDARPAPKFVSIPAEVLEAALGLGKGHLETLMRFSRYLWGGRSLEGSSRDFCNTLGVDLRSWQRHVPELGRSGCLRYSQPQHGYYTVHGYPDDVVLYRECWARVSQQVAAMSPDVRPKRLSLPGLVDALFLSGETSILSFPVVVPSSSVSCDIKSSEKAEQQHGYFSEREGGMGGEGGGATVLARVDTSELSCYQRESYDALRGIGMWPKVALAQAVKFPRHLVRRAVDAAQGAQNPAAVVRLALKQVGEAELAAAWEKQNEMESITSGAVAEDDEAEARKPEATYWDRVLGELELQMTRATFDAWLRGTEALTVEGETLVVGVKNPAAVDWLDHRLRGVVERTMARIPAREAVGVGAVRYAVMGR